MKLRIAFLAGLAGLACAVSSGFAQDEQADRQARLEELEEIENLLALERNKESELERLEDRVKKGELLLHRVYVDAGEYDITSWLDVVPVHRDKLSLLIAGRVLTGELTFKSAVKLTRKYQGGSRELVEELPQALAMVRAKISRLEKERERERAALGDIVAHVDQFWSGQWRYKARWIEERPGGAQDMKTAEGILNLEVSRGEAHGTVTGLLEDGYDRRVEGSVYEGRGLKRLTVRPAEGEPGLLFEIAAVAKGDVTEVDDPALSWELNWPDGPEGKHGGHIEATKQ